MFELVQDDDGNVFFVQAPVNDNEREGFAPAFDPHGINGLDDGDPHFLPLVA